MASVNVEPMFAGLGPRAEAAAKAHQAGIEAAISTGNKEWIPTLTTAAAKSAQEYESSYNTNVLPEKERLSRDRVTTIAREIAQDSSADLKALETSLQNTSDTTILNKDRGTDAALQVVREEIKKWAVDRMTNDRASSMNIAGLSKELDNRVSQHLLSKAEAGQIINDAITAQRTKANEILAEYRKAQDGIDETEATRRSLDHNKEIQDLVTEGIKKDKEAKAATTPRIKGMIDRLTSEISTDPSIDTSAGVQALITTEVNDLFTNKQITDEERAAMIKELNERLAAGTTLQAIRTAIQDESSRTLTNTPGKDSVTLRGELKTSLDKKVAAGLITAQERDNIMLTAINAEKQAVNSLVELYKNDGVTAADLKARAAQMNDDIEAEISKQVKEINDARAAAKAAKDKEKAEADETTAANSQKVKDLTTQITNEFAARISRTSNVTKEIQARLNSMRSRGQISAAERAVLERNLTANLKGLEQIKKSSTIDAARSGTDILEGALNDSQSGLPGEVQNAVQMAVNGIRNLESHQVGIEEAQRSVRKSEIKVFEEDANNKKREYNVKRIQLLAKYSIPAGIVSGTLIGLAGGGIVWGVMGGGAFAIAGGELSQSRLTAATRALQKLEAETELEENRLQLERVKKSKQDQQIEIDRARRLLATSTAAAELSAGVLATKTGLDIEQVRKLLNLSTGTGNVEAISQALDPENFGLALAA